jgi:hypothetical protein
MQYNILGDNTSASSAVNVMTNEGYAFGTCARQE